MARKTLRRLIEKPFGTEWDRLTRRLQRRNAKRILVVWNRGLGDIALGMWRVLDELRRLMPDAAVTVLTRPDLADAFRLLPVDQVLIDALLTRRSKVDARRILRRLGVDRRRFDLILGRPDPTHWFRHRPGQRPRLRWPSGLDDLSKRFDPLFDDDARLCIGVHVHSETSNYYAYRKDWPIDAWRALFERIRSRHAVRFVLFGLAAEPALDESDCIDVRGRTSFLEMMALIKTHCRVLIAPDSGVLTMTYYLDVETPIDVISLWSDPRQGILKHGFESPNPLLRHRALLSADERVEHIAVDTVAAAVEAALLRWQDPAPTPREAEHLLTSR